MTRQLRLGKSAQHRMAALAVMAGTHRELAYSGVPVRLPLPHSEAAQVHYQFWRKCLKTSRMQLLALCEWPAQW
jgi:hypothetical protein